MSTRAHQWRERMHRQLKIFVIEKNQAMAGFASISPSRDKDTDPAICGEISAIYLDPAVWRQGLGKILCEHALLELKNTGFHEVIVWVFRENHQAIKFYENLGFTLTPNAETLQLDQDVVMNVIRYIKTL